MDGSSHQGRFGAEATRERLYKRNAIALVEHVLVEAYRAGMTDEQQAHELEDPDGYEDEAFQPNDFRLEVLLQVLTGSADDGESTAGITLVVDGQVVVGTLISGNEWGRRMRQRLNENVNGEDASGLAPIFQAGHEEAAATMTRRREAGLRLPKRAFLHLRDVQMFVGDSVLRLPEFRVQTDRISGWTLGTVLD